MSPSWGFVIYNWIINCFYDFSLYVIVHPEDIEKREYKLKKDITELELQRDELLVTNLNMKTDMAEV